MQSQLGQYLKGLRVQSDLTLNSISKKIKVRQHFLEQIENDDVINMPKIIIRSYILSFGKAVSADKDILLSGFDELYKEEKPATKVKLPDKKNLSSLFIWLSVFILLALSVGLMISNKNQSKIQTAEFKSPNQQELESINYSSPKNLEELLLNLPNPSFDNKNKK